MINIDRLNFRYRSSQNCALNDISLHIPSGVIFGLLGPNGAGKTTLISLLCGLLTDKSNAITFDDKARSNIGYIPQEYAFYPAMNARENLSFFAGVQGLQGLKKQQRIQFSLQFCQLKGVAEQRADTFSGGLKRRLNIAIGLLTDPDILLFDEPTVGIDPQSRAFILKQIKQLNDEGKTIIYTSHYMEEVEKLCDHIAIIDAGKVLAQGSISELQQTQQNTLQVSLCSPLTHAQKASLHGCTFDHHQLQINAVTSPQEAQQWLQKLQQLNVTYQNFQYGGDDLENLFLKLTQRELRD